MLKTTSLYIILITFTLIACETEFVYDPEMREPTIIIEGWITDTDEPQKVIVSRSLSGIFYDSTNANNVGTGKGDLVYDAIVIISSDTQPADTLKMNNNYYGTYYFTEKIKGIPGETYYLRVENEGKIYEATTYMPPVPEMDSISFDKKQVEKENAILDVPLVNFYDPADEENYYLFRTGNIFIDEKEEIWLIHTSVDPWAISLFSDKYINGTYATLNTREGITTASYWMDLNYYLLPGERIFIQMQSLTKDAYDYYKALVNQLNYTAGVFHPSPANPPTNISNGGQGYFGASAVSRMAFTIPEN